MQDEYVYPPEQVFIPFFDADEARAFLDDVFTLKVKVGICFGE